MIQNTSPEFLSIQDCKIALFWFGTVDVELHNGTTGKLKRTKTTDSSVSHKKPSFRLLYDPAGQPHLGIIIKLQILVLWLKKGYLSNCQREHDDKHIVKPAAHWIDLSQTQKVYSMCSSSEKRPAEKHPTLASVNATEAQLFGTKISWSRSWEQLWGSFFFFSVKSHILRRLFMHTVQGRPSYYSDRKWPPNIAGTDLQPSFAVSINHPTSNNCCEVNFHFETWSFRQRVDLSNGVFYF